MSGDCLPFILHIVLITFVALTGLDVVIPSLHETHACTNLQVFWLQTLKLKLLQISLPSKRLMSLPNLSTDLSLCALTF